MKNIPLDKLKKDDLVKVARAMKQEIKLLKKTKAKQEVEAKDLPLLGISSVQVGPGEFKLVRLAYDLDTGVAAVTSVVDFQKAYKIFFEANKIMIEEVHKQIVVKEKKDSD